MRRNAPFGFALALSLLLVGTQTATATHLGPAGRFHIEATGGVSGAFDFEAPAYVSMFDPSADVRLGLWPGEVAQSVWGYKRIVGLNGAVVAVPPVVVDIYGYPGYYPPGTTFVDFADVGCADFGTATFGSYVEPALLSGYSVLAGSVLLVKTGNGTWVKMVNDLIDFTNPNGLGFTYQSVDCSAGPSTKGDALTNVPGQGLDTAPGLQKPFNPKSQAAEHAGRK